MAIIFTLQLKLFSFIHVQTSPMLKQISSLTPLYFLATFLSISSFPFPKCLTKVFLSINISWQADLNISKLSLTEGMVHLESYDKWATEPLLQWLSIEKVLASWIRLLVYILSLLSYQYKAQSSWFFFYVKILPRLQ